MGLRGMSQKGFLMAVWVFAPVVFIAVAGICQARTYVINPEIPGATAAIKDESLQSNPTGRTLKTPTYAIGPDDPAPSQKVIKKVVQRFVPQRLRFNRISVNGSNVQPRVKFARDAEIFQGARIRNESIRADFFGKVGDDLTP